LLLPWAKQSWANNSDKQSRLLRLPALSLAALKALWPYQQDREASEPAA